MKISPNSLVKRSESLISARLGDSEAGTVVLDNDTNSYFGLDGVAAFIWNQLREPLSLSALVEQVVSEYEVDADSAAHDAREFIVHLIEKGLVDVEETVE